MNLRLLIAEGRKLKVISIFLPVISGMLLLAITVAQWYYHFHRDSDDVYILFNVLYMLLPFSIFLTGTILTSITIGTEHESQGWKQILTLPFPRIQLYLAKFIWLLILMLIQGMVICLGIILIWTFFTPLPLPLSFLIKQVFYSIIAYMPVLIIQFFLAIRLENQAVPIACGILGAIASRFLPLLSMKWLYLLPWSYTGLVSPYLPDHLFWLQVSIGMTILLLLITAWWFQRLDWK